MSASDNQVGGSHYKDLGEFQPWDVLKHWLTPEEYRGYQKGVAIAYLARERAKGGDQDIRKAVHHLQRLIEEFEVPEKDKGLTKPPCESWIKWAGGPMPVPRGAYVEVRHRSGLTYCDQAGQGFAESWTHSCCSTDIVEYRLP